MVKGLKIENTEEGKSLLNRLINITMKILSLVDGVTNSVSNSGFLANIIGLNSN